MSTAKVVNNPKYHVGTSTDVTMASTPASLYYENQFSFLPPSCQPSLGAIQRVDVYNTASVRGLATNFDLVFDIVNTSTTDFIGITSLTKCWQWVKVYLDDVQVQWLSDADCAYLCQTRNLSVSSNSLGDYKNLWIEQGTEGFQGFINTYDAARNISLAKHGDPSGNYEGRVTIPVDYFLSGLFHRWDTALVQKISLEIKWRPNTGSLLDIPTFIVNDTTNANPYPYLNIVNSYCEQRLQLYTDMSMFKPLSEMYVKSMLKFERQDFTLSKAVSVGTVRDPARIIIKLSDSFSYHKRILGLTLILNPTYTAFGGVVNNNAALQPGQVWSPNSCTAIINKGGKVVEDLSNFHKFTRQSNHFQKCLGSEFQLDSEGISPIAGNLNLPNIFNGNVGNYISFLDRNLMESHSDLNMLDKINLVGGISNDLSEAWSVQVDLHSTLPTGPFPNYYTSYGNQLTVYMIYSEVLGVKASPGHGSQVKIFS